MGGDEGDRPGKRARKLFLNVAENKSSDRKLSLIPFVSSAFSVAGPAAWNSLSDYLRDPSRSFDSFRRDLKLFSFY